MVTITHTLAVAPPPSFNVNDVLLRPNLTPKVRVYKIMNLLKLII